MLEKREDSKNIKAPICFHCNRMIKSKLIGKQGFILDYFLSLLFLCKIVVLESVKNEKIFFKLLTIFPYG